MKCTVTIYDIIVLPNYFYRTGYCLGIVTLPHVALLHDCMTALLFQIMTQRGENDWQSEKTLSECMRYMFDNEIATDVIFVVGPPDGATVYIRAHKYMLISRSAVFEAMFSSGMTECSSGPQTTIRVEDIDAAIFRDLLL